METSGHYTSEAAVISPGGKLHLTVNNIACTELHRLVSHHTTLAKSHDDGSICLYHVVKRLEAVPEAIHIWQDDEEPEFGMRELMENVFVLRMDTLHGTPSNRTPGHAEFALSLQPNPGRTPTFIGCNKALPINQGVCSTAHTEPTMNCRNCNLDIPLDQYVAHLATEQDFDAPVECPSCAKGLEISMYMTEYKKHVWACRSIDCQDPDCDRKFWFPQDAIDHYLYRHTDERPYTCKDCGKSFEKEKSKKRHEEEGINDMCGIQNMAPYFTGEIYFLASKDPKTSDTRRRQYLCSVYPGCNASGAPAAMRKHERVHGACRTCGIRFPRGSWGGKHAAGNKAKMHDVVMRHEEICTATIDTPVAGNWVATIEHLGVAITDKTTRKYFVDSPESKARFGDGPVQDIQRNRAAEMRRTAADTSTTVNIPEGRTVVAGAATKRKIVIEDSDEDSDAEVTAPSERQALAPLPVNVVSKQPPKKFTNMRNWLTPS
jgi:hypothetical protein